MKAEILIIDDNPDIRTILKDLIDDSGFKTRVAANYNQALMEIDKQLPDVAIIDVKLDKGDNDGIELLSYIKKKNKDIPVIIISGHANIEMAVESLKSGFKYGKIAIADIPNSAASATASTSRSPLYLTTPGIDGTCSSRFSPSWTKTGQIRS